MDGWRCGLWMVATSPVSRQMPAFFPRPLRPFLTKKLSCNSPLAALLTCTDGCIICHHRDINAICILDSIACLDKVRKLHRLWWIWHSTWQVAKLERASCQRVALSQALNKEVKLLRKESRCHSTQESLHFWELSPFFTHSYHSYKFLLLVFYIPYLIHGFCVQCDFHDSNFELRSVTTLGRKAWTWPRRSMAQLWCQLPTTAAESDTTSQRILGGSGRPARHPVSSQSIHRLIGCFIWFFQSSPSWRSAKLKDSQR